MKEDGSSSQNRLRLAALAPVALVLGWLLLVKFPYDASSDYFWLQILLFFVSALGSGFTFALLEERHFRKLLVLAILPLCFVVYRNGVQSDATMWPVGLAIPLVWFLTGLAGSALRHLELPHPKIR